MARGGNPATWSATDLAKAVTFATDWLGVYLEEVNALNVYPVPDGDTGTNMHLTMQSVRRQLADSDASDMAGVAHALSYGSLLGARGNSGVILSQVLKGFAESIRDSRRLTGADLAEALVSGSEAAYAAVMKPVEGTILTVVREAAEAAEKRFTNDDDAEAPQLPAPRRSAKPTPARLPAKRFPAGESLRQRSTTGGPSEERESSDAPDVTPLDLLRLAFEEGQASLARTPDLLPILKQAGVVDAGGHGFLRLIEGIIAYFEGLPLPPKPKIERRAQQQFEEEEFGFCTEFLLADVEVPTQEIRELVAPYGDSLLVVGAEGFVKGHIHTEEPEKLLAEVSRFGRMVRSKVEDMSEQHSEILADVDAAAAEAPRTAAVAVASGYGITRVFRSLRVRVVGGGQTDNPSVQDIADAVRSVGADDVIVMPNNKNIILAAERVGDLVEGKRVRVLPTRTLGQGLAAAVLFQESAGIDELFDEMEAAAQGSLTLEVTRASRDVELNGVSVREGDAIGLVDGQLQASARGYADVLLELLEAHGGDYEVASLFYAPDIGDEGAQAVVEKVAETHPDLEVEVHAGAPDLYPFLVVLE